MKDETPERPVGLGRRGFLGTIAGVAAGAALASGPIRAGAVDAAPGASDAGATAAADGKTISLAGGIPTRRFGRTGHVLPLLGHGGSAMTKTFIRMYGVELVSEEDRSAMVRLAYDRGVRYFDNARVYGESERLMGAGLKGVRHDVYLASKVATHVPAQVRRSVETSLTDLGTDHVDCMQIHSPVIERVGYDGTMLVLEELQKLREEKMIRFLGVTTHVAFEDVHRLLGTGAFDQVLLAYGHFRRGMTTLLSNRKIEWRDRCLSLAREKDCAIVAMKVLGANIYSHNSSNLVADFDEERRKRLAGAAIRWVLQDDRVAMLNIGMSVPQDVEDDVAIVKGDLSLTEDDRLVLADFAAAAYDSETVKAMEVS